MPMLYKDALPVNDRGYNLNSSNHKETPMRVRRGEQLRFDVHPDGSNYNVTYPCENVPLMRAEILALDEVTFGSGDGVIHASIQASWGITYLDEEVYESPWLLRALGFGQRFLIPGHLLSMYREGGKFYCYETNRLLYHAPIVFLSRHKMFYQRGNGR